MRKFSEGIKVSIKKSRPDITTEALRHREGRETIVFYFLYLKT